METDLKEIGGQFIQSVSVAKQGENQTDIWIDLYAQPDYQTEIIDEETTRIRFSEPKYEHITYSYDERGGIALDLPDGLVAEDIIENSIINDQYEEKQWSITFKGNYMDWFSPKRVDINDSAVDYIAFSLNEDGNTEMLIQGKHIYVYKLIEKNGSIHIELYKPKEVYNQVIVIDPGHGGSKPGANVDNYYEKDINLQVVLKLKSILDEGNTYKVYYTRLSDKHVSLEDRAEFANDLDADFFLSIHSNSFTQLRTGAVSLYYDDKDNKDAFSSYELAKVIHNKYVESSGFVHKNITYRDDVYVLKYTKMPATLLELGYMTNPEDLSMLTDEGHQWQMAQAIYNGIIEVLNHL